MPNKWFCSGCLAGLDRSCDSRLQLRVHPPPIPTPLCRGGVPGMLPPPPPVRVSTRAAGEFQAAALLIMGRDYVPPVIPRGFYSFFYFAEVTFPARWRDAAQANTSSALCTRWEFLQTAAVNQGNGGTTPRPPLRSSTRTGLGILLAGVQLWHFAELDNTIILWCLRNKSATYSTTTTLLNSAEARGAELLQLKAR